MNGVNNEGPQLIYYNIPSSHLYSQQMTQFCAPAGQVFLVVHMCTCSVRSILINLKTLVHVAELGSLIIFSEN